MARILASHLIFRKERASTKMAMDKHKEQLLRDGTVIPAHPLVLDDSGQYDEKRMRLLTRYYLASGVGGIAVGVHTTQFEIRNPEYNLYATVLETVSDEIENARLDRPLLKVAGVSGDTSQAVKEAKTAADLGYDIVLLSQNGLGDWTESQLLDRAQKVGEVMPLFGFYLQPAVGGRVLSRNYWRKLAELPSLLAIKMAPFNRYQTLDVVQSVAESTRSNEISLYTGNDDNIVADLLTKYDIMVNGQKVEKRIVGGLLGHWAVWTRKAVELLEEIKKIRDDEIIPARFLTKGIEVTDTNAVFFDAANDFHGCIPGLHEVLRRQGLLVNLRCLNPDEKLSKGQLAELDRVYEAYPHLNDDEFVSENIETWKKGLF